ncbi:Bifunctional adenosylcobalamin biosynthesis protein CobU [subsurface metagenome]
MIVDCITLLVSNIITQYSDQRLQHDAARIEQEVVDEIKGLIDCTVQVQANFIIVTNEVGLGLVPTGILGRLYRDFLGRANQMLAQRADEVYLMAAGIPVLIKP